MVGTDVGGEGPVSPGNANPPEPSPSGGAASAGPDAPASGPDAGPASQDASAAELRRKAARRRALDALFGEVLPDITGDETDRADRGDRSDRWYSENRPPHHG